MNDRPIKWMGKEQVCAAFGLRCTGSLLNWRRRGILTKPVYLGKLAMWPEHELRAIDNARLRGATDDQVRALVKELEAARSQSARSQSASEVDA